MNRKKKNRLMITLLLWGLTGWMVFPLLQLEKLNADNAEAFIYRTAFGITLMIIFFGKTVFDLVFPGQISKKVPLMHTFFLTLYALLIAGGIIFFVARLISAYIRSRGSGIPF